MVRLKTMRIQ